MKRNGRNQRHWITVAIFAIIFGLPLLLPWAAQQAATSWLHENGAPQASIDDIDINLFTGKLDITGFNAGEGLRWQRLSLRINWLPLLEGTLHIRTLQLQGADIRLQQTDKNGKHRIGPLLLPQGGNSRQDQAAPWLLVLDRVTIEDVSLAAGKDQQQLSARIALLSLRGGPGRESGVQQLHGEINLDRIALQNGGEKLALDECYLAATLTLPPLERLEEISLTDGLLLLERARLNSSQGDAFSLQALRLKAVKIPDADHLRIGQATMAGLKLRHDSLQLITLGSATIDGFEMDRRLLPRIGKVVLRDITLPADEQHALGRITSVTLNHIATASSSAGSIEQLAMEKLIIGGLDLALLRQKEGMAVIRTLATAWKPPVQEGEEAAQQKPQQEATNAPAIAIGAIEIGAKSRLVLHDETISPVLRLELQGRRVTIANVDSSGASEGSFKAAFVMNRDGALDARGSFRLKPGAPELNANINLIRFDISSLSGYLEQGFGHTVQTGQLDMASDIAIAGNNITAKNSLTIRRLSVKKGKQSGSASARLGMPLNTALDMLRDSRGDIALKVPLSGRLDDPNIDISDAINQALASAMGSAALSYASLLLQPYGSILPALSYTSDLLKAASKPRLTPIAFNRRSQQLGSDAIAYAGKLAELLNKKPLRLELCGIAHRSEAAAAEGDATTLNDEQLLQLAAERAQALKEQLTVQGIEPERLFNCRPAIDEKSKLAGRVELLLD